MGRVVGFKYNGNSYYYGRNLQGDVVELYCNGKLTGQYEYDAWGAIQSIKDGNGNEVTSSTHAAKVNPFRYRGYYYDEEIGLYYLNSRYYDPVVKRFINADQFTSTEQGINGYNMFIYCLNNPVNMADSTGKLAFVTIVLLGGLVCTLISGLDAGISASMSGQDFWAGFGAGCIGGVAGYGTSIVLGSLPVIGPLAGRAVGSFMTDICNDLFQTGEISWLFAITDALWDISYSLIYALGIGTWSDKVLGSIFTGITDSIVDTSQTGLFYSPTAQESWQDFNNGAKEKKKCGGGYNSATRICLSW